MQYPVIDLIISAYINNGWTGLDIVEGKNLIDVPNVEGISSAQLNVLYNPIFTNGELNTQYTFSCDFINADDMNEKIWGIRVLYTDNTTAYLWILNNGTIIPSVTTERNKTVSSIDFAYASLLINMTIEKFMLEKGATATPFEPYSEPRNDFPNRLKLPLPHYFPRPVIDALQRAAAGTQTADDTEILQHYLIPLGIGGI